MKFGTIHRIGTIYTELTLSWILLKNGLAYFQNLAVFSPKGFYSKFDHFSRCMKGLTHKIKVKLSWKQANLHKLTRVK